MATHRALHDYEGKDEGFLSFKRGELFTLQNESGNGWFTVKNSNNKFGLVPSTYLESIIDEEGDTHVKGSSYVVLYDYDARDTYQLTVSKDEKLILVDRHTKEWWSMKNAQGESGFVPSAYVKPDKQDDTQALSDILLSIDRAIEKIHNEATIAGGIYTAQQRTTLQSLIEHRRSVVGNKSSETSSLTSSSIEEINSRRKPPPPPSERNLSSSELAKVKSLDLAGIRLRQKGEHHSSENRPKSLFIVRPAPPPPRRVDSLSSRSMIISTAVVKPSETLEEISEEEEKAQIELKKTDHLSEEVMDDNLSQSSEGSGVVSAISPDTKRRISSYLNRVGDVLETVEEAKIELPSEFPTEMGVDMVDIVRNRTGLSHVKSALAVEGILKHIGEKVPVINQVMEGLLAALHTSQIEEPESAGVNSETNKDLERLREVFFEIKEARDDSQQRGWAIRDDSGALLSFLEELLQIIYDADPVISRTAIQEDKYENILILISYYQLEHRIPLRILLMKIFGALCTLDEHVISILIQSVLPNELGHGIELNINETETVVWSGIVCTMMFSTSEEVPFSVYDQWNLQFVHFLLNNIEEPPHSDIEDEIPDIFLNMLLSFNQHFEYPSTNLVMKALKESSNPRIFSEKLMLLVNRGDDPVCIKTPCCPDSLTKILLDLFADKETSRIFYTTDLMVLIDIITRQLLDHCPGEKIRSHYLELLHRLLDSTEYEDHRHRRSDLVSCLKRIMSEEGEESRPDQEAIKRIWETYPGVLNDDDS